MKNLLLTIIGCLIGCMLLSNCQSKDTSHYTPSTASDSPDPNLLEEADTSMVISDIPLKSDDPVNPTKKTTRKKKNKVASLSVISSEDLNTFFQEIQKIHRKGITNSPLVYRFKNSKNTWVDRWKDVQEELITAFPHIQKETLEIVGIVMKLSDKNSKEMDEDSMEEILVRVDKDFEKVLKNAKDKQRKILQHVQVATTSIKETYERCSNKKKKGTLEKIYRVLCLFEKILGSKAK